ncbi:retention module-containing protein [Solemya velesiana gill symbiont]|uniref:Uncharacterized protein n=1 Tax=Solemya velesiana gill symbiont TaxID=1918948 RepID=A0A1T2KTC0_9GAMM|nr:retention module-containing protein [Solemya velesiana gill symbiont]OOZ35980.1 hypothetical protein BOW51_09435 [Solemya velesiana gill symbiont]
MSTSIISSPIGLVEYVEGSVTATSTDGITRILAAGDAVFAGDTIRTGDPGLVEIVFDDGTRMDMGRDSVSILDSEVYDPTGGESAEEAAASIEAIQEAILAGQDPSALLAPTAAGPTGAGGGLGDSVHDFVQIFLTGQRGAPESGFETRGLTFQFDQIPPGLLRFIPDDPNPTVQVISIEDPSYISEDNAGTIIIIATTGGEESDELTAVNIGNLPTDWDVTVDDGGSGGSFEDGVYTPPPDTQGVILVVTLIPPEDSDVDLPGIIISAEAQDKVDGSTAQTEEVSVSAVVDAVLDHYVEVQGGDAYGDEAATVQYLPLELDLSLIDSDYPEPSDESGDTTQHDIDPSEVITVTISVDDDEVDLRLNSDSKPDGAELIEDSPGIWTLTADAYDLSDAVEAVEAIVPAGYEGLIEGSIDAVSRELNTPPDSTVPASGEELDISDNVYSDVGEPDNDWTLTVRPGEVNPTLQVISIEEPGYISEDNAGTITIIATTGDDGTDQLTAVNIGNLPTDWDVTVDDDGAGGSFLDGVYTPADDTQSVTLTVTLSPPEDSDEDLSGITVSAEAEDKTSGETGSTQEVTVGAVVDAVLDHYVEVQGGDAYGDEATIVQHLPLELDLSLIDSDYPVPSDEPGDTTQHDIDPSEVITVTISVDDDEVDLHLNPDSKPDGAELTESSPGIWTLTADAYDLSDAVEAVEAIVPAGYDGLIEGSIDAVSRELNTPPDSSVPASGDELDISDNVYSDVGEEDNEWTLTVTPGTVDPNIQVISLEDPGYISEDGSGVITIIASVGDETDQLTAINIGNIPDSWTATVSEDPNDPGTLLVGGVYEPAPDTQEITLYLTLTPPEDSDEDILGITVWAEAEDISSGEPAASNVETVGAVVDAVLDHYVAVEGGDAYGNEAAIVQHLPLELDLSLIDSDYPVPSDEPGDTTQHDIDPSEVIEVTITVHGDEVDLRLNPDSKPAGAELTESSRGTWTLTADAYDLEAAVEAVEAIVPAGYDGLIEGSIDAVSRELNTPPDSTVPESGVELETSDNVYSDVGEVNNAWTLLVDEPDPVPTVEIDSDSLWIQEDGSGIFTVTATVSDNVTDELTGVEFTNLHGLVDASWTVTVDDGDANGSYDDQSGIYTPEDNAQSVILTVTLTPPADSDVDVLSEMAGDIQVRASASDLDGSNAVDSAWQGINVNVDAVAEPLTSAVLTVNPASIAYTIGDNPAELYTIDLDDPNPLANTDSLGQVIVYLEGQQDPIDPQSWNNNAIAVTEDGSTVYAILEQGNDVYLVEIDLSSSTGSSIDATVISSVPTTGPGHVHVHGSQGLEFDDAGNLLWANGSDVYVIPAADLAAGTVNDDLSAYGSVPIYDGDDLQDMLAIAMDGDGTYYGNSVLYGFVKEGGDIYLKHFEYVDPDTSVSGDEYWNAIASYNLSDTGGILEGISSSTPEGLSVSPGSNIMWFVDRAGSGSGQFYHIYFDGSPVEGDGATLNVGLQGQNGFEGLTVGADISGHKPGQNVTFTAAAEFELDIDGSEEHFFLLEIPDYWQVAAGTDPDNVLVLEVGNEFGVDAGVYLRVDVTPDETGSASTTVSLIAPQYVESDTPYEVSLHAVSHELVASDDAPGNEEQDYSDNYETFEAVAGLVVTEGGTGPLTELSGTELPDVLIGGSGGDLLVGDLGDDTLVGGEGGDTFMYLSANDGLDTIKDYSLSEGDSLDLTGVFTPDDLDAVFSDIDSGGADYLVIEDNGDGSGSTVKARSSVSDDFADIAALAGIDVGDSVTLVIDGQETDVEVV